MEGGTGLMAYGELACLLQPNLSGMDDTGLACWSYMIFAGSDDHLTTVLVGYNPCHTTASKLSTTYQLHRAFYTTVKHGITCPCKSFQSDLIALLMSWRNNGQ